MATKRKTGKDYRKEFKNLKEQQKALEIQIRERLRNLCTRYSDIKYCTDLLSNTDINSITIDSVLNSIEIIEEELAKTHPHKQKEIEFPNVSDVPESPDCPRSPDKKHHFEHDGSNCSYCGANVAYL